LQYSLVFMRTPLLSISLPISASLRRRYSAQSVSTQRLCPANRSRPERFPAFASPCTVSPLLCRTGRLRSARLDAFALSSKSRRFPAFAAPFDATRFPAFAMLHSQSPSLPLRLISDLHLCNSVLVASLPLPGVSPRFGSQHLPFGPYQLSAFALPCLCIAAPLVASRSDAFAVRIRSEPAPLGAVPLLSCRSNAFAMPVCAGPCLCSALLYLCCSENCQRVSRRLDSKLRLCPAPLRRSGPCRAVAS